MDLPFGILKINRSYKTCKVQLALNFWQDQYIVGHCRHGDIETVGFENIRGGDELLCSTPGVWERTTTQSMLEKQKEDFNPTPDFFNGHRLGKVATIGYAFYKPFTGKAGKSLAHRGCTGRKAGCNFLDVKLLERPKAIIEAHLPQRRVQLRALINRMIQNPGHCILLKLNEAI
ncbi:hypothetical protein [Rhizobium sp. FKY42]|uniref:hypothetical protein n=1 Tax=Rhizobium sp. FKY42 TaxID=2562310 RepID=UPI001FEDE81A|nr:hypothetical protein [Rhizobium sp. FKY42]